MLHPMFETAWSRRLKLKYDVLLPSSVNLRLANKGLHERGREVEGRQREYRRARAAEGHEVGRCSLTVSNLC